MANLFCVAAFSLLGPSLPTHLLANDPYRRDDLFDVSRGLSIIRSTPIYDGGQNGRFDIRDMFGGTFGTFQEQFSTIFQDNPKPDGDLDYVEFETQWYIRLSGYQLFAGGDPFGGRYIAQFRFFADINRNGTFTQLDSFQPDVVPAPNVLTWGAYNRPLTPVVARRFRIEMVRDPAYRNGPRVVELDAETLPTGETLPDVGLTSPLPDQVFTNDQPVLMRAAASDPDGIFQVEFHLDGEILAIATSPPFEYEWSLVPPGYYSLFVRAYDIFGNMQQSDTHYFEVKEKIPDPIQLSESKLSSQGTMQFKISPLVWGKNYHVYISENLVDWRPHVTFPAYETETLFADWEPVSAIGRRYYRVLEDTPGNAPAKSFPATK